jgi:hypothetical protein
MDIQQLNIANALAEGKTDVEAYRSGMACLKSTAEGNASKYLKEHPEIRQKAYDLVQTSIGMTLPEVLEVVRQGTEAYYENKEGKQLPDFTNRLEAAKLLLRLHNELQDKPTSDIHIDNRSVHIELSPDYIHMLNSTLDRFDRMNKEPDIIDGEIVRPKADDSITDV